MPIKWDDTLSLREMLLRCFRHVKALPIQEDVRPDLLEMKMGPSARLHNEISLHKYSVIEVAAYCKATTDFWGNLFISGLAGVLKALQHVEKVP